MSAKPLDPAACRALVAGRRWLERITVTESGCWVIAYSGTPDGYAKVRLGDITSVYAHRVALVAHLGRDLAPGMQAGHTCHDAAYAAGLCASTDAEPCDHRRCVNPTHLVEQDNRANNLAGGSISALLASRTHCPAGHPLDGPGANLRAATSHRGPRACRPCHLAAMAAHTATIRAARQALGMTDAQYRAKYGRSQATAERVLAELST